MKIQMPYVLNDSVLNDKELAALEEKFTTGDNDINKRDILDDTDLRNIICDLIHELHVARAIEARANAQTGPPLIN